MELNNNNMSGKTSTPKSGDSFLNEAIKDKELEFQKNKEAAAVAKSNATDKEAFDFAKFSEMYNTQGGLVAVDLDQKAIDTFEIEYYLKYSDVKSLEEFASKKAALDKNEAN